MSVNSRQSQVVIVINKVGCVISVTTGQSQAVTVINIVSCFMCVNLRRCYECEFKEFSSSPGHQYGGL